MVRMGQANVATIGTVRAMNQLPAARRRTACSRSPRAAGRKAREKMAAVAATRPASTGSHTVRSTKT
jgi:hypothetical protein